MSAMMMLRRKSTSLEKVVAGPEARPKAAYNLCENQSCDSGALQP